MATVLDRVGGGQSVLPCAVNHQTKTGLALGSVYSYAVSGAAIGFRFMSPVSSNLSSIWFFVTATAGTPGVLTVELRPHNTTTATKPGAGAALATQTVSPGTTANKWIQCTFGTPYTLVAGNYYWIVIGDAGWTTGNTATVLYKGGLNSVGGIINVISSQFTTADGFATAGSGSSVPATVVLKFADGTVYGSPFTTWAVNTSNDRQRGIKILGLTEKTVITGAQWAQTANVNGLKIYSGNTAPGGTADLSLSFAAADGVADIGTVSFPAFTLQRNTLYRIVLTYSAAATGPLNIQKEDFSGNTDITNCGFGGGMIHQTIDNGAGGWTDNIDKMPYFFLVTQGPLAVHGGSPFRGVMG